jgi:hypothetical protein
LIFTSNGSGSFDISIDIDDLFNYNGLDNLLLDITIFNNPSTSVFDAVGFPFVGGPAFMASVAGTDASATSGLGVFKAGLVTQFSLLEPPAPIPEPSTLLLLVSGLAGLGFFRRRRKAA